MTEVIMPKMGDGMEEGTLLKWSKPEGSSVKMGDVIGEIQTDKATLELEAPGSGTLVGFLIGEGDTVPVGQPIAMVLGKGEQLPDNYGANQQPRPVETAKPEVPAEAAKPADAPKTDGRVKASPLARRLAEEAGIDLGTISGSGPGGRVVERDVRPLMGGAKKPAAQPSAPAPIAATAEDVRVPLTRLRSIIAERTLQAKLQAPHFYVTVEMDVEKIMSLREQFKAEEGGRISVNDFVVRACTLALREMPEANASFQGDHILRFGAVNIGVAVAIDEGLVVPVIKNAERMTLRQLSDKTAELVARARENKLLPDEMSGSTFSISNMGMLDVDVFGAILNLPNAAIVAISTARRKVVVQADDELEVRWRMNVTGSFDHRVLDGASGAKFMNVLKGYIENPTRLLS